MVKIDKGINNKYMSISACDPFTAGRKLIIVVGENRHREEQIQKCVGERVVVG